MEEQWAAGEEIRPEELGGGVGCTRRGGRPEARLESTRAPRCASSCHTCTVVDDAAHSIDAPAAIAPSLPPSPPTSAGEKETECMAVRKLPLRKV